MFVTFSFDLSRYTNDSNFGVCFFNSNRNLEITRTNGEKTNNGFSNEATNLLRSLINNRQIGITPVDGSNPKNNHHHQQYNPHQDNNKNHRKSPNVQFYKDTQGTMIERHVPDSSVLGNRTNIPALVDIKVCYVT